MIHSVIQRAFILLLSVTLLAIAFTQSASVNALRLTAGQGNNSVSVVSAASFAPRLAPDSIAAAFGSRLAVRVESAATQPLPTQLAGTTVRINGQLAPLFFVAPDQVNFLIPAGTAPGNASLVVTSGDGAVSTGTVQVSEVAPAVFTANASGRGVPAAVLQRVKPDGTQSFEAIHQFDPAINAFVPRPISLGSDRVFLILYLSGIRHAAPGSVRVSLNGVETIPLFSGAAGGFAGLDQINVEIGRNLSGRISAQVESGSVTSNLTEIEIAAPGRLATSMTITPSANATVFGQTVSFTARVNAAFGVPPGAVIFRAGAATLGSRGLSAGRAEFALSSLAAGNHQITAHYNGDASFSGSWATLAREHEVRKASTSVTITSSANPSTPGQQVTFTAQINALPPGAGAPTGQVIFTDNGVMIGKLPLDASAKATITVPLSTAGNHAIAANYEGDGNFDASSGSLSGGQTVVGGKAQTRAVVTSSANPAARDQEITLTASVSVIGSTATPTGEVQFKDNGANLGVPAQLINGSANLNVNTLALGNHSITAEYFGDPNFQGSVSGPLAQSVNAATMQVGNIEASPPVYAGDEIKIQGNGFSGDPAAHQVEVIEVVDGNTGITTNAQVVSAATNELRVRVPFGARSGKVKVILDGNAQDSPDQLQIGTSISGFVQEAVRQPDNSLARKPIAGVTMRAFGPNGQIASATSTSDGSFVVKFPPSAVFGNRVDLEVDGGTVPQLPFPKERRSMRMRPSRDNQYSGDTDAAGNLLANIIELKPSGAATTGAIAPDTRINEQVSAPAPASPEEVRDRITSGQVVFDTNNSVITGGGPLALTVLDAGRAPSNLPTGRFSSTIAQITPFGATLTPGGKLTFPNSDGIPAGTEIRVFRFDQTPGSDNLGKFIDIGPATISADGARIETGANDVKQTSYYFVSRQWPVASISGRVVDGDGRPARRAVVTARGQSVFTDNNGGFALAGVPVITPSGLNDQTTVEVSFVRPDGSVARAQRDVAINANAATQVGEDFTLPRQSANRQPRIVAPLSLSVTEGETQTFGFAVDDPDGQPVTVSGSGVSFASLSQAGTRFYSLRLDPPVGSAGNHTLQITAADGGGATVKHTLTIAVRRATAGAPTARHLSVATNEDTPASITLEGSGAPRYTIVSPPSRGRLDGAAPNLRYTPNPNYNGPDSFSFKVEGNGRESNVATVFIAVNPVNDQPTIVVPGAQALAQGQTINLLIEASDVDADQTLRLTATGMPPSATLIQSSPTRWQFSWTPTFGELGVRAVIFKACDNGAPQMCAEAATSINIEGRLAASSGLEGGTVWALLTDGPNIFAGTIGAGLFRSTDQGRNWVPANAGIPPQTAVYSLVRSSATLYAGTYGGVYRSTNNGASWEARSAGLWGDASYSALLRKDSLLFAGNNGYGAGSDDGGIYRSTNDGASWTAANRGLPKFTDVENAVRFREILALAEAGGAIYAATFGSGVYRSFDNGNNWFAFNAGLTNPNVYALKAVGGALYASTVGGGIFRLAPGAANWVPVNNGLTDRNVYALLDHGVSGMLLAGTYTPGQPSRVFASRDGGQTWSQHSAVGLPNSIPFALAVSADGTLCAGTGGTGLFRAPLSANQSQVWTPSNSGLAAVDVTDVAATAQSIFATTSGTGIFRSRNNGQTWQSVSPQFYFGNKLFVHQTAQGTRIFSALNGGVAVQVSDDDGESWRNSNLGIAEQLVSGFAAVGATLYAGTFGQGVFRSDNGGDNWAPARLETHSVTALAVREGALYAGTLRGGVHRLSSDGQTWVEVNNGLSNRLILSLLAKDGRLFAGTGQSGESSGTGQSGVFRSDDGGQNWRLIGLAGQRVFSLAARGRILYAATRERGVFWSANDGERWDPIGEGQLAVALAANDSGLLVGARGGLFLLANSAESWSAANAGLSNTLVNAVLERQGNLLAGTVGGGVFRSSDQGQSWQPTSGIPANANIQTLAANGATLFAGAAGQGVYRSDNGGIAWRGAGLNGATVSGFAVRGGKLYASVTANPQANQIGVFVSTDNGASWSEFNSGLGDREVNTLAAFGDRFLAGTHRDGLYVSDRDGAAWRRIGGFTARDVRVIEKSGNALFAGTIGGGVHRSEDNGETWRAVNNGLPPTLSVYALKGNGDRLYAGSVYGVFVTTNGGASWRQVNAGLGDTFVTGFAVSGNRIFAGTLRGGVFKADAAQP